MADFKMARCPAVPVETKLVRVIVLPAVILVVVSAASVIVLYVVV